MEETEIIKLETEIIKLENKIIKSEEIEIHLSRLERIESLLPKPKGIFVKKCPICGKRLVKDAAYYRYFYCDCGYEYYDPVIFYE